MKAYLTLALIISFLLPLGPQEPVDNAVNAKIRDEGLNRSQVLKTFTHFTEVIGPRLTGGPEVKAAAEYSQGLLKEWGVTAPHLEPWDFGRGWSLEAFRDRNGRAALYAAYRLSRSVVGVNERRDRRLSRFSWVTKRRQRSKK